MESSSSITVHDVTEERDKTLKLTFHDVDPDDVLVQIGYQDITVPYRELMAAMGQITYAKVQADSNARREQCDNEKAAQTASTEDSP